MPQQPDSGAYDLAVVAPLLERGATVLTPNLRLARRIVASWNAEQAEQGRQSWPAARVYAIEAYLEQRWRQAMAQDLAPPRRLLGNLAMQELWQRVIEEDRAANGDYPLLQVDGAAALAQQARENLLRAAVDTRVSDVRTRFQLDPDCACFLRWLDRFERELDQLGAGSLGDAMNDLLAREDMPPCDEAVLLDFDDVPALYLNALETLCVSHAAVASGRDPVRPRVVSYPDRRTEIDAIAAIVAAQYRDAPERRVGIVLSDMHGDRAAMEYALRREFDCLGDNYTALPVNFSTGISLDQAPVVRDALGLMELLTGPISYEGLLALFRSRFIAPGDVADDRVVRLFQRLAEDGAVDIELGRVRYLAQEVTVGEARGTAFGNALARADELRLGRRRQLPSEWVSSFNDLLACWSWPGTDPLDSIEYQQVERWYEVLDTFAGFDEMSGVVGLGQALALLRRCCQDRVSQPQTADSRIQVLGPLEGAGLQFDTLWLSGFQGSRWPAPARPNPFIPVSLQRSARMPHSSPEREWEYAEGLLNQYRAACAELFISYAVEIDGVSELPSALLEGFEIEAEQQPSSVPAGWQQRQATAQRIAIADHSGPGVSATELGELAGGSSIVQNQAACPFQAFARHRLKLTSLSEPVLGLSPAERGNLLHNALYALWGELGDSDSLQGMSAPDRRLAAERAAATAVGDVNAALRQIVGGHCLDLEQQRLAGLLQEWLALEAQREPFVVVSRESTVDMELAGMSLRLRVDRIDELASGERLVIDYKSGRSSLGDWMGERMRQPQLPLYGVATGVDAVSFAQVRARDNKFIGLGSIEGVPGIKEDIAAAVKRWDPGVDDWNTLVANWRQALEALAGAFVAGAATVDPLADACTYCGLQAMCRVQLQEQGV